MAACALYVIDELDSYFFGDGQEGNLLSNGGMLCEVFELLIVKVPRIPVIYPRAMTSMTIDISSMTTGIF